MIVVPLLERLKYRLSAYFGLSRTYAELWNANVEITGRCNLQCKMCGFAGTRAKGAMNFETFTHVIGEIKKHGRPIIGLHQFGEPLLHPDIERFIAHVREQGLPIYLYTNATQLDERRRGILSRQPVNLLRVSFEPRPEVYERIWKNAEYAKTLDNLQKFLQESQAWPIKPTLSLNLLHERGADLAALKAEAVRLLGSWPNLQFEYDEMVNIYGSDQDLSYTVPTGRVVPCVHTYTHIAILHNGDVAPCCNDLNGEVILGNIKTQSLAELRNGPVIRDLRRRIAAGRIDDIPICKNCNVCRSPRTMLQNDLHKLMRRARA